MSEDEKEPVRLFRKKRGGTEKQNKRHKSYIEQNRVAGAIREVYNRLSLFAGEAERLSRVKHVEATAQHFQLSREKQNQQTA